MQNDKRKKILFVITKSVWGGAQRYVFDLATHLPREEFETAVATVPGGALTEKLAEEHVVVFPIAGFQKSINPLKDIISFFELLAVYRRFQPDIIHTNSSKAGGIAGAAAFFYNALAAKNIMRVFTVHGLPFEETWRPHWQRLLIRYASKITVLLHDHVIVISENDRRAALSYNVAPSSKVTLIHNGIEVLQFLPRAQAQHELFGQEYPLVIGTIAEWTKNKGLDFLIVALPAVLQKFPEAKLCLIGWGEESAKCKVQSAKLGLENHVFFISKSPAAPYLKAFDIFVLPSLKEGLPYTLLEAGLAGLPVVATRVGGVPDIIEHEKNGFLVSPISLTDLADSIIQLCQNADLRKQMGEENKRRVTAEFSLETMMQKTIALYKY